MVLQTGRKVYPFLEKGAWFPGVRATLSWTRVRLVTLTKNAAS